MSDNPLADRLEAEAMLRERGAGTPAVAALLREAAAIIRRQDEMITQALRERDEALNRDFPDKAQVED